MPRADEYRQPTRLTRGEATDGCVNGKRVLEERAHSLASNIPNVELGTEVFKKKKDWAGPWRHLRAALDKHAAEDRSFGSS
jgi:hypothetical protein